MKSLLKRREGGGFQRAGLEYAFDIPVPNSFWDMKGGKVKHIHLVTAVKGMANGYGNREELQGTGRRWIMFLTLKYSKHKAHSTQQILVFTDFFLEYLYPLTEFNNENKFLYFLSDKKVNSLSTVFFPNCASHLKTEPILNS